MVSRNFRDLVVWQKSIRLATACYRVTNDFPSSETYGLTGQIRRSAASVPANIAEGQGRATRKDFLRSLAIAHGSLNELESHLMLAARLGFLPRTHEASLIAACNEVSRLLTRLRASLGTKSPRERNRTQE